MAKSPCLFCQIADENAGQLFATFTHCFAIKDRHPVTKGHLLIIPYQHTDHWFTASEEVQIDMLNALTALKLRLDIDFSPDGYNIGINCGEAAGQTINHLHLHLIPRYKGDVEDPSGGIRGVIPSKQHYTPPLA